MDIAHNAVFLASDESEWTTAQVFIVDGGITTFDACVAMRLNVSAVRQPNFVCSN